MAVSAGVEALSSAYEEAELRIIDLIASRLKKGAEAPDWAVRKLQELALTKRQIKKELNKLAPEAAAQVSQLLRDNYERGQAEALDTLIQAKMATPYPGVIQASKEMSKLLSETTQSILESHNRILRSTDDAYRKIVSRAASDLLLGTGTRSDMIQRGLNEFADKGITGFVDKRGRNWEMKAYVEMAAGTAAHRASTQGHLEKLKENGHNLVVVSDHKGECDLCRKWEGEVLAIDPVQDAPEPPIKMPKDEQIKMLEQRISDELTRESEAEDIATKNAARANVHQMRTELKKLKAGTAPPKPTTKPVSKPTTKPVSKPTPKPASKPRAGSKTRPELEKLLGNTGESLKDATKRRGSTGTGTAVNPKHATSRGYQVNCTRVTAAAELRARGYKVVAAARESAQGDRFATFWRKKNGDVPAFEQRGFSGFEEAMLQYPDGSRFAISGTWDTGGTHIWNAEIVDRKLVFREGQAYQGRSPEELKAFYLSRLDQKKAVSFLRMDDLVPLDNLLTEGWVEKE